MARDAARKYDAGAAAFFVENLCQDADTLLRFGFALTLSEEIAGRLVYKTFESIVPNIPEFVDKDPAYLRLLLMRRTWELHHEANQEGQGSAHVLFPLLKPLDLETRAVLFMVDVIGLTVEEACGITKMNDDELRRHLAHGRKRLLGFRFE